MGGGFGKLKNWGLTLVLLGLFSLSIAGQIASGMKAYNEERVEHRLPPVERVADYLPSGHFISSVCENMESEFLQMALFVILTAFLLQRGSAESKKPKEDETEHDREADRREEAYRREQRRRHPVLWRLYEQSLSSALAILFMFFFAAHAAGSRLAFNEERASQGKPPLGYFEVFGESEFWFESFQNWQSEFFSIAVMGLLSIVLRQRGSPQSKRLDAKIGDTGSD